MQPVPPQLIQKHYFDLLDFVANTNNLYHCRNQHLEKKNEKLTGGPAAPAAPSLPRAPCSTKTNTIGWSVHWLVNYSSCICVCVCVCGLTAAPEAPVRPLSPGRPRGPWDRERESQSAILFISTGREGKSKMATTWQRWRACFTHHSTRGSILTRGSRLSLKIH